MWAKRYTPIGRGFDSYLGYLSADEQYYTHYKWPPFHGGSGTACGYRASLPSLYNVTDLINGTDGELRASDGRYTGVYSTFMYGAEADRILDEAAARQGAPDAKGNGRSPFFLYVAAQSIHTPLEGRHVQPPRRAERCHCFFLRTLAAHRLYAVFICSGVTPV